MTPPRPPAKRKAGRKARSWTQWATVDWIGLVGTYNTRTEAASGTGEEDEVIRVRITEVLPPARRRRRA